MCQPGTVLSLPAAGWLGNQKEALWSRIKCPGGDRAHRNRLSQYLLIFTHSWHLERRQSRAHWCLNSNLLALINSCLSLESSLLSPTEGEKPDFVSLCLLEIVKSEAGELSFSQPTAGASNGQTAIKPGSFGHAAMLL